MQSTAYKSRKIADTLARYAIHPFRRTSNSVDLDAVLLRGFCLCSHVSD